MLSQVDVNYFKSRSVSIGAKVQIIAMDIAAGNIVLKRSNPAPGYRLLTDLIESRYVVFRIRRDTRIDNCEYVFRSDGHNRKRQRRRFHFDVFIYFITENYLIVVRIRSQNVLVDAALLIALSRGCPFAEFLQTVVKK